MWEKIRLNSIIFNNYSAKMLFFGILLLSAKGAQALTADDILNKMSSKEQTAFISGYVGGMAYTRWLKERPDKNGMNCIYHWFHGDNKKAWGQIDSLLVKNLDKSIEPLLYVLIKKECGV